MSSLRGSARRQRPRRLLLALLLVAPACAADRNHAAGEPPAPSYESRTGVPLLMDLPVLGFLFSRRTVAR